jgi:hypothetical protein
MEHGFERTGTAMAKLKKERDDFEQENIKLRKQLAAAIRNGNPDSFATNINQAFQGGSTQTTNINHGPVYIMSPVTATTSPSNASAPPFGQLAHRPGAHFPSIPASATNEDVTAIAPADKMDIDKVKKRPTIKPPRFRADCIREKMNLPCRRQVCQRLHDDQRELYRDLIRTLPSTVKEEQRKKL